VPELPEVETVVRDLRPYLIGMRLGNVRAGKHRLRRPWSPAWNKVLTGRQVEGISRRGKWIVLFLQGGPQLVIHLGMTGQLTVVPSNEKVLRHTHLVVELEDARQLRFRDVRRFGGATLFPRAEALAVFFEKMRLGPEPFGLDPRYWQQRLSATQRPLKAILLDQRVVAGVGNIYADESLFEAGLHPGRTGCSLRAAEANRLRRAMAAVLERAIRSRGSSVRTYVGGSGRRGRYQEQLRVYGRTGQPCRRCGTSIQRIRLAGRSTHWCPRCQGELVSGEWFANDQ
jgi:formamidopyrimidine-DNA glycosylase